MNRTRPVPPREYFPLLRPHAIDLDPRSLDAESRLLVEAALEGRATVQEVLREERAEGLPADAPVVAAPYDGRFHYAWVLVDLGLAHDEARPELLSGLAGAAPQRVGLVLSRDDLGMRWPHVHALAVGTADAEELRHPVVWVQFVRAVLRSLPPTRVFLADVTDAVLLDDALDGHELALGLCSDVGPPRPACMPSPAVRRGQYRTALSWLRDRGEVSPDALRDLGHGLDTAWRRLLGARGILVPGRDGERLRALLSESQDGALLPYCAGAISSHLTPGENLPARIDGDEADSGRATSVSLTPRAAAAAPRRVLYACLHLLGDVLNATPVLHLHRVRHPDDHVTLMVPDEPYARLLELSPDVDRLVYVRIPDRKQLVYGHSTPFAEALPIWSEDFDQRCVLDVQAAASSDEIFGKLHVADGYAQLAGVTLESRRPSLDVEAARGQRPEVAPAEPFVVFARHTVSGQTTPPGDPYSKRWAERRWRRLAERIRSELGLAVVSLGTPGEGRLEAAGVRDLHHLTIQQAAGVIASARAVVCVDNGLYHLAQALGTPFVHVWPPWLPEHWSAPCPEVAHRDLQADLRRLRVPAVLCALSDLLAEQEVTCKR